MQFVTFDKMCGRLEQWPGFMKKKLLTKSAENLVWKKSELRERNELFNAKLLLLTQKSLKRKKQKASSYVT